MDKSIEDAFKRTLDVLARWQHLDSRMLENGTKLVGHVPHVAPKAYLHMIFAPLTDSYIALLEKKLRGPLPDDVRQFLRLANGINIFSGALSIDGLRANYDRVGDAARQPFDMSTGNVSERPKDADDALVFVGGYRQDGLMICVHRETGRTYRTERTSASQMLNEWNSFGEMLTSETLRLASLFDESGKKIDKDAPTVP